VSAEDVNQPSVENIVFNAIPSKLKPNNENIIISDEYCVIGEKMCFGKRFSIIVSINDIEVKTLLDSGSGVPLMSAKIAEECGVKLKPTKVWLRSAFDNSVKALGAFDLKYEFDGQTKSIEGFVAERTSCPLLLGSNFFEDNGLVLDHGMKCVAYRRHGSHEPIAIGAEEVIFNFKSFDEKDSLREPALKMSSGFSDLSLRPKRTNQRYLSFTKTKDNSKSGPKSINQLTDNVSSLTVEEREEEMFCFVEEYMSVAREWYPRKQFSLSEEPVREFRVVQFFEPNNRQSFLNAFKFENLSDTEIDAISDILWQFQDVFSQDDYDVGHTTAFRHRIETEEEFEHKMRKIGFRFYSRDEKNFLSFWSNITKVEELRERRIARSQVLSISLNMNLSPGGQQLITGF
jgi:hypothetical protein